MMRVQRRVEIGEPLPTNSVRAVSPAGMCGRAQAPLRTPTGTRVQDPHVVAVAQLRSVGNGRRGLTGRETYSMVINDLRGSGTAGQSQALVATTACHLQRLVFRCRQVVVVWTPTTPRTSCAFKLRGSEARARRRSRRTRAQAGPRRRRSRPARPQGAGTRRRRRRTGIARIAPSRRTAAGRGKTSAWNVAMPVSRSPRVSAMPRKKRMGCSPNSCR